MVFQTAKWITENKSRRKKEEPAEHQTKENSSKTLSSGEVVASVINPEGRFEPAPLFRKNFRITKAVKKAEIRTTAAGLYRLFLNGLNLNRGLYDPGWTDYEKRIQFQTAEVTGLLKEENTVEILAGCGWAGSGLLGAGKHFFTDKVCVLSELLISYEDGTEETIETDETWDVYHSALRFTHPYQGEVIDYGQEPEYTGRAVAAEIKTNLIPQEKEYVTAHERIPAKRMFVTPDGDTVIDFGQNLAGYAEIRVTGYKGDKISVRHAETLDENGNFYTKNLRTAAQLMEYTLGHDGVTVLQPVFTFQGFRYIAVKAEAKQEQELNRGTERKLQLKPEDFTAVSVYTGMKRTGTIETGNDMVNRLCECILWNMRSNFLEVPTDCPQRDERLGWLGDAQVFCKSAGFYYDVYNFYRCWLKDIVSEQREDGGIPAIAPYNRNAKKFRVSAAWADALTIIPVELYRIYGDKTVLEECFPAMCRYVEYLRAAGPEEYLWLEGEHYGDWLALDGPDPRHPKTDKDMIASAYYYHSVDLLIYVSEVLERPETEIEKLRILRENIRIAFRARFLNVRDTYAALTLLLSFGLLEPSEMPEAAAQLAKMIEENGNRLLCGVVGAPLILHALSENGYVEKAFDLLLCDSVPSWMGMLRYGATTLWERLDTFDENGMKDIRNASLNHYMFGAVLDWITGCAGGCKPLLPGYRKFSWKPLPDKRLGKLRLTLLTRYGEIEAFWEISGNEVHYRLTVPEGTEAVITLPGSAEEIRTHSAFYCSQQETLRICENAAECIVNHPRAHYNELEIKNREV